MSGSLELLDLPPELLITILQCEEITCEDLLSVYWTCRPLQEVATTNSLWMNKLFKIWPYMKNYKYSKFDWFEQYKNIVRTHEFCKEKIMKMSATYYWLKVTLSDCHMKDFVEMSAMYNGLGHVYLLMFLRDLCAREINITDSNPHTGLYNLTNQYYGSIVLDYLNRHYLTNIWAKMCENPHILTPERVSFFFGRWMQPEYGRFDSDFDAAMEAIVKTIKSLIPTKHPLHQIDDEKRTVWSKELIKENKYDPENCKSIIKISCDVLKRQQLLSSAEATTSSLLIRNVIERKESNNVYNAIILEAVLRRCGVRVDIVYFSNHRLLIWREDWAKNSTVHFVNALSGEVKSSACPFAVRTKPEFFNYSPIKFLSNLTACMRNVESAKRRSMFKKTIELMTFLEQDSIIYCVLLGEVYIDYKRDTRFIEERIQAILNNEKITVGNRERTAYISSRFRKVMKARSKEDSPFIKKTIKHRSASIKLAVGLICYHKVYGYLCVVHGWDYVCMASNEWKANMGVQNLTYGDKQPFYHILATDFTERYVAEENLVCVLPAQRLECIEEKLAVNFSHFNGYFYIPNAEKGEEYPEDAPIRAKYRSVWLSKVKCSHMPSPEDD